MRGAKINFTTKVLIIISVLLLLVNILCGTLLMNQAKNSIQTLLHGRMLDIVRTASDMLDGDVLKTLQAEDEGTEGYQSVVDTLTYFQDNIELKYIYCVRDMGDGTFTFTVDPTVADPAEFGQPVVYTDALYQASRGIASVDAQPYEDEWGWFYSAYSPVFDSEGNVAGIVAVDFNAEWYEIQILRNGELVVMSSVISLLIGGLIVTVITSRIRRKFRTLETELSELESDLEALTKEIDVASPTEHTDSSEDSLDEINRMGEMIRSMRSGLKKYVNRMQNQANSMITALASDYRSVYYVDLDKNEGICYRSHSKMENGLGEGEEFPFQETFTQYANDYVTEQYREGFLRFISPESIRKELAEESIIAYRYLIVRDGQESYEMLRMAGVRRPEDRDDHIVHAIGVGFSDVDKSTREALEQRQALSDALVIAQEANKAKTAFLSNMSHEIRTPMNAIISLDSIALHDAEIPEQTREYLQKIGGSAKHLLGIINDILDMSRIESGRMVLKNECFSFTGLLEQVNNIIGSQCNEKGIRYDFKIHGTVDDSYIGDDTKLRQVVINILGNAVKFTPKGGTVAFRVERTAHYEDKATLRFVIRDTGIGMDPEFIPRLFDPFSQEDSSTTSKYGSTGLGMAITKNIVDMMNGEIEVESTKGVGTTFTVTITLLEVQDELKAQGTEYVKVPGEDAGEPSAEQGSETEEAATLEGCRILLAEDVDINAEIMVMLLEMRGMETEHALNGKIAVEMFAEHPEGYYDAILMDMRMPEMDGLTATVNIRGMERPDAETIPIIAMTANAFEEDVQNSLQAGLNAHLSKPVDPDQLYETLEHFIRRKEKIDEA